MALEDFPRDQSVGGIHIVIELCGRRCGAEVQQTGQEKQE
jgi:hypothetical protein